MSRPTSWLGSPQQPVAIVLAVGSDHLFGWALLGRVVDHSLNRDPGKSLPSALSQKYLGEDPPPEPDELARVIVRVIPERVNAFSA